MSEKILKNYYNFSEPENVFKFFCPITNQKPKIIHYRTVHVTKKAVNLPI